MICEQASNLILLALASASLLGLLVLECRADQDDEVERAKKEWLSDWDERVGEHMVGKVTPEATAEILKQLHAAMPQDKSSKEWQKKRTELDNLIDMVNMDEECLTHNALRRFNKKYDLSGYLLPVGPLLQDYAKYFQNKQIEICAAKITEQVAVAVASLFEYDKQDMDALMSYSPKLKASDNLEWDENFLDAIPDENEKRRFYRNIYKFLNTKDSCLSTKGVSMDMFGRLFDDRMVFCTRLSTAMRVPVSNYTNIRWCAMLDEWTSRFNSETLKWIKADKLCWQIRANYHDARVAAYDGYIRAHKSRASKILDRVRPKRASD